MTSRVALVHDWLTGFRGGEKVLEVFCELFPQANLYTLIHVPGSTSPLIEQRRIVTSPLQHLPGAARRYRHFLPLMPWAVSRWNFSSYDAVISLSHCVAKGVRVPPQIPHLCYCFTPMRYVWDQFEEYFVSGRASFPVRAAMALLRRPLQNWDVSTSRGVTHFVAISHCIHDRIKNHYGRESSVVYPPVDAGAFPLSTQDDGYYLVVSALVPYKRVDVAVDAFAEGGRRLVVVGRGPEEARLKKRAGPSVRFVGWEEAGSLAKWYGGCRALIFPGEEDFGIVPLEAMAAGKPVIALGRGGALETVISPEDPQGRAPTGLFFQTPTAGDLSGALDRFERERVRFLPEEIRRQALRFDRPLFKTHLAETLRRLLGPRFP